MSVLVSRKKDSPNLEEASVLVWEDWSRSHGGKEQSVTAGWCHRETSFHYQCMTLEDDIDL